jgi:putative glutathione S-transferase
VSQTRTQATDRPTRFGLGAQIGDDGRYVRDPSAFRGLVSADAGAEFPAAAGRYHLYVSLACPWSHRTVIGRLLKGLGDAISVSYIDPFRDARGWAFTGGEFVDDLNGFRFLREAYVRSRPGYDGNVTVPVLWDKESQRIVSNESGDILRMLGTVFDPFATRDVDLCPVGLREEIDALNERVYEKLNNAVYRAGFSRSQSAYEEACADVFVMLDELEARLGSTRYLVGDAPTEADWRLFATLVRFDTVYYLHFKCNVRRVVDYASLWDYTRDLYQLPGIAGTVAMDQIKRHYYTTHDMINPSRIIPAGPALDFLAPHGRG